MTPYFLFLATAALTVLTPGPGIVMKLYAIHNTNDGRISYAAGITHRIIVRAAEGSFGYVPFDSEADFLKNLEIVTKYFPSKFHRRSRGLLDENDD